MSVRKHLENYLENTTLAEMAAVVKHKIQNLEENAASGEQADGLSTATAPETGTPAGTGEEAGESNPF
jgi:hypothetical protein